MEPITLVIIGISALVIGVLGAAANMFFLMKNAMNRNIESFPPGLFLHIIFGLIYVSGALTAIAGGIWWIVVIFAPVA